MARLAKIELDFNWKIKSFMDLLKSSKLSGYESYHESRLTPVQFARRIHYAAESITARPQQIYRVEGDKWGSIFLCSVSAGGKSQSRSFYISQMKNVHVD